MDPPLYVPTHIVYFYDVDGLTPCDAIQTHGRFAAECLAAEARRAGYRSAVVVSLDDDAAISCHDGRPCDPLAQEG